MSAHFARESSFAFDELFFSRTNSKGIIESSNSVFQRVSKYEWDEILKKPHNVVRHPAMPRGVFHLLWQTILSGKPVGAYVVNQAKDESYYWVYALVSPIDDGYLSVRLKPSSPTFEIMRSKYAELLNEEKTKKISPKESHALLLQTVESLGFKNYQHFMTESLTQELEYRQKALGLSPIHVISQLREVMRLGSEIRKKCEEIVLFYRASARVPLNLEAKAARIGQEAAPIAVVSAQYEALARQIQQETKKFMEAADLVQSKIEECQFAVGNLLLQKEMFAFFKDELKVASIDSAIEMGFLEHLSETAIQMARQSLVDIENEFAHFNAVSEEVRQLATGLEIVNITGRIEAAKIKQSSGELLDLLNDLAKFKVSLNGALEEIRKTGNALITLTNGMKAGLASMR